MPFSGGFQLNSGGQLIRALNRSTRDKSIDLAFVCLQCVSSTPLHGRKSKY